MKKRKASPGKLHLGKMAIHNLQQAQLKIIKGGDDTIPPIIGMSRRNCSARPAFYEELRINMEIDACTGR